MTGEKPKANFPTARLRPQQVGHKLDHPARAWCRLGTRLWNAGCAMGSVVRLHYTHPLRTFLAMVDRLLGQSRGRRLTLYHSPKSKRAQQGYCGNSCFWAATCNAPFAHFSFKAAPQKPRHSSWPESLSASSPQNSISQRSARRRFPTRFQAQVCQHCSVVP